MTAGHDDSETVAALIGWATSVLEHVASARLDAELLLAHAAGRPRSWVHTWPDAAPGRDVVERFRASVARRAAGQPVAYLTGRAEFWSLELEVTAATLVPRPETEALVAAALPLIDDGMTVLDLGTGCGAIAIALASERPRARIVATDVSRAALAVARRNAQRHGRSIDLVAADWLAPFTAACADIIVSNPPYVAAADPHLDGDGVRAEPREALVAGPDGLDALRVIVADARRCLRRGGHLLVEHGHDQAVGVRSLFAGAGLHVCPIAKTALAHEHLVAARRPS